MQAENQISMLESDANMASQYGATPEMLKQQRKMINGYRQAIKFVEYLNGNDTKAEEPAVVTEQVEETQATETQPAN